MTNQVIAAIEAIANQDDERIKIQAADALIKAITDSVIERLADDESYSHEYRDGACSARRHCVCPT
tara:strand:+ start:640 stop:837 length:198 start_codon:yes stop_codon:yes gene_type:complete